MKAQQLPPMIRAALEHSFARYIITGGLATLVYFLSGLLFVRLLSWPLLFGNACAFIVAFIVSYTGHRFWAFQQKEGRHAVFLPRFAAVQVGGLAVNSLIIAILDGLSCPMCCCASGSFAVQESRRRSSPMAVCRALFQSPPPCRPCRRIGHRAFPSS